MRLKSYYLRNIPTDFEVIPKTVITPATPARPSSSNKTVPETLSQSLANAVLNCNIVTPKPKSTTTDCSSSDFLSEDGQEVSSAANSTQKVNSVLNIEPISDVLKNPSHPAYVASLHKKKWFFQKHKRQIFFT